MPNNCRRRQKQVAALPVHWAKKKSYEHFCKIYRETPTPEYLFWIGELQLYQNDIPAQVISFEFFEVFKNIFYEKICERITLVIVWFYFDKAGI